MLARDPPPLTIQVPDLAGREVPHPGASDVLQVPPLLEDQPLDQHLVTMYAGREARRKERSTYRNRFAELGSVLSDLVMQLP